MANFVIGPEWTWMWRGRPLRTHHLFGDICVLEYWKYSSLERPRSSVPTFHDDGLNFRLMATWWRFIAEITDRADKLFFNQWTVKDCPPFHIKPWGKFSLPRSRHELWSEWYDPLPELFNATVDPWTKCYGVMA